MLRIQDKTDEERQRTERLRSELLRKPARERLAACFWNLAACGAMLACFFAISVLHYTVDAPKEAFKSLRKRLKAFQPAAKAPAGGHRNLVLSHPRRN